MLDMVGLNSTKNYDKLGLIIHIDVSTLRESKYILPKQHGKVSFLGYLLGICLQR